jgi:hypothetical protein
MLDDTAECKQQRHNTEHIIILWSQGINMMLGYDDGPCHVSRLTSPAAQVASVHNKL